MLLGSVLEFVLGNTFPFVVFGSFGLHLTSIPRSMVHRKLTSSDTGAFWLSFGGTLVPIFNAAGAFAGGDQGAGLETPGFSDSFGI